LSRPWAHWQQVVTPPGAETRLAAKMREDRMRRRRFNSFLAGAAPRRFECSPAFSGMSCRRFRLRAEVEAPPCSTQFTRAPHRGLLLQVAGGEGHSPTTVEERVDGRLPVCRRGATSFRIAAGLEDPTAADALR
jgi:hypothetical protein